MPVSASGEDEGGIRAIVFDLGGVVFRYLPQRRLDALAHQTGLGQTTLTRRLFDSGFSASCDGGTLTGEQIHREACRLIGRRMSMKKFSTLWLTAFAPDENVVNLVRRLGTRYRLALATNNSTMVREGLTREYPEVMNLFRPQVFSCDLGVMKPDPRMFRTLATLLDTRPENTVYIDDSPVNVAAAASLSMIAIRFTSAEDLCGRLESLKLL